MYRKNKLTHDQCRRKVCIICMQKCKGVQIISPSVQILIDDHFLTGLSWRLDSRLPNVMCIDCRMKLVGKSQGKNVEMPPFFDYSKILRPQTRLLLASCVHNCAVCEIAAARPVFGPGIRNKKKKKGLVQMPFLPATSTASLASAPLLCSLCGSIFGRGHTHVCRPSNWAKAAQNLPLEVREQLASSTIREKSLGSTNGDAVTLKTGGKEMRVLPNPQLSSARQTSASEISQIMSDENLRLVLMIYYFLTSRTSFSHVYFTGSFILM